MEVIKAREPTKRDDKLQDLKGETTTGKEIIGGTLSGEHQWKGASFQKNWLDKASVLKTPTLTK